MVQTKPLTRRNRWPHGVEWRLNGGHVMTLLQKEKEMTILRHLISLFFAVMLVSEAVAVEVSSQRDIYRIGPNDVIRVQVFGEDELSLERKVEGDGKIDYPLLGAVPVESNTVQELQQYLTARLASGYLRHPKVSISIVRHRNFYVSGEVKTPGGFPYEQGLTVHKAITIAGGFTEKASKGSTKVLRTVNGQEESFETTLDSLTYPGDIIVVPQRFF